MKSDARFTKGDSIETTRKITAKDPPKNVRTHSHVIRAGSGMPGMPGDIKTGANSRRSGEAEGGRSISPKWPPRTRGSRESEIGEKGGRNTVARLRKEGGGTQGGREAWMGPKEGHRGRMERLRGSAKSFGEGGKGRKSVMY